MMMRVEWVLDLVVGVVRMVRVMRTTQLAVRVAVVVVQTRDHPVHYDHKHMC